LVGESSLTSASGAFVFLLEIEQKSVLLGMSWVFWVFRRSSWWSEMGWGRVWLLKHAEKWYLGSVSVCPLLVFDPHSRLAMRFAVQGELLCQLAWSACCRGPHGWRRRYRRLIRQYSSLIELLITFDYWCWCISASSRPGSVLLIWLSLFWPLPCGAWQADVCDRKSGAVETLVPKNPDVMPNSFLSLYCLHGPLG